MTTPSEPEAYSNPVRLSVATREPNATAGPSTLSERERLLKARISNEVVRRKGEKWADKLMEETVDRDTFKRAVSLSVNLDEGYVGSGLGGMKCGLFGVLGDDESCANHVPLTTDRNHLSWLNRC